METCEDVRDGFCDDGGPGAKFSLCSLGTDCTDCGSRSSTDLPTPLAPPYSPPPGVTAADAGHGSFWSKLLHWLLLLLLSLALLFVTGGRCLICFG
jgi:hypothetical protein